MPDWGREVGGHDDFQRKQNPRGYLDQKLQKVWIQRCLLSAFNLARKPTQLAMWYPQYSNIFYPAEFVSFSSGPGSFRHWYATCIVRFRDRNTDAYLEGYGKNTKKTSAEANSSDDLLQVHDSITSRGVPRHLPLFECAEL